MFSLALFITAHEVAVVLHRQTQRNGGKRLGYATQLTSVRYLGTFPEDLSAVPDEVL